MKNYYFDYKGYGECYTVMAESEKKAIDIVYAYIRKKDPNTNYKNKKLLVWDYDIEEYEIGEVIETENS